MSIFFADALDTKNKRTNYYKSEIALCCAMGCDDKRD